jgi:hypothetical protein
MFPKEAFAWAGGYRRVVVDAEDYDLWLRIADRNRLANLEAVVLKYRIHPHQVSVRKLGQQALGALAAQTSSSARRSGQLDPLNSVTAVTPESLAAMGISVARQQNHTVSYGILWIRNMILAGEYSAAVKAAHALLHSDLEYVERHVVADLRLMRARVYWKQRRYVLSLFAFANAYARRPKMLARPMKPLLQRLHLVPPPNVSVPGEE